MTTANLLLNCFPVELSPATFQLPFVDYANWKTSTEGLEKDYVGFSAHRYELETKQARVVLLDGPEEPRQLEQVTLDVAQNPHLGTKLIDQTLSHYLTTRGMRITRDKSTTKVAMQSPAFSKGVVDVFHGIEFQVRRPFEALPYSFVISAQWKLSVLFRESLSDTTLQAMSPGMSVLYKPLEPRDTLPPDLQHFRYRYLGHIHKIESNTNALVRCKDGEIRSVPLTALFFEGSPAVLREYEKSIGGRYGTQSIWHKIQELEFVLNKTGRRNSSVLKDRLQAIRKFLGSGPKEQLVLPLSCFRDGSITLGLSPARIELV